MARPIKVAEATRVYPDVGSAGTSPYARADEKDMADPTPAYTTGSSEAPETSKSATKGQGISRVLMPLLFTEGVLSG
jgi:hypothetical protein